MIDKLIAMLENISPDDDELNDCLDDFERLQPNEIHISCGETRYAVIFKHQDFVLKIPRYGYRHCSEDYCQAEIRAYQSAIKYGIERILLPIELYYTTASGIAIYKQPKYSFSTAEGMYRHNYDTYLNKRHIPGYARMINVVSNGCYEGNRISRDWLARVLQLYGKKFCRSFEKWSVENQINDLHNSNTGWLNNKPIILDYAGYRG